jgi:hypothetical protein
MIDKTADSEYEKNIFLTHLAMCQPAVGDRFQEFYSFWVYVVKVTRWSVWTAEASPPCVFPEDAKLIKRSRKDFIKHFSYKSTNLPDKHWVTLCDRGNCVHDWYKFMKKRNRRVWKKWSGSASTKNSQAKTIGI